jgi:hypothetical protein
VPTIRRTARERGRRAQIVVDFDSLGTERRLEMELESGLFRMIDEALAGYLSTSPRRVWIRLDWGDQVEARISAHSETPTARPEAAAPPTDASTPAALVQMIYDRRTAEAIGENEARPSHVLPTKAWREIMQRATTLGMVAELLAGGTEVRIVANPTVMDEVPAEATAPAGTTAAVEG